MHVNGIFGILLLIGWIMLIIAGFKDKDWWWGLIVLFVPLFGGLIFGILRWPGTKTALILYLLGLLLGGSYTIGIGLPFSLP